MSPLASVAQCCASDSLVRMAAVWALICAVLTIYDLRLLAMVLLQTVTPSIGF
jgi:hypothetical protein